MGSAFGLARRTLSGRPFQRAPCSTHRALSRSAALRNVTKAQGGCPKSLVLWGCSPKRPKKRRTSLKLAWRGTFCSSNLKISEVNRPAWM
uniref:Uncharacterized protein n=1 Tax=Catagonus wagneri TaxID=51154 RepID=A0A8C3W974_9CETA